MDICDMDRETKHELKYLDNVEISYSFGSTMFEFECVCLEIYAVFLYVQCLIYYKQIIRKDCMESLQAVQ